MKWQLLLVGLLLMGCVASVGAVRENFQGWGASGISGVGFILKKPFPDADERCIKPILPFVVSYNDIPIGPES